MEAGSFCCAHTHTNFCDGRDAPEAMVQAALNRGFAALGFSGHGAAAYDSAAMSPENERRYRAEIQRLQRAYDGQLEICLGQEHDALSPYADFPYEFLIESVHYISVQGVKRCVDWSAEQTEQTIRQAFGGDAYAYTRAYFETCARAYAASPAQIAGHLDLVAKFNEGFCQFSETDPRYLGPALEALDCAVRRGMVVELNTGAMARGCRASPYPGPALLRRLRDLGGKVMVNSDCHDARFLTFWYAEAAAYLQALGFRSVVTLRKNGLREVALD